MTEGVSQKASWVLKNREGVCDELTNLFIAMNRALGIPAKFISGVAYTNSESFGEGFGPHGWAEVYFPGYGWIPFDVTYGEFGFVDAGHIKLKESTDANDASTRFQWLGHDVNVEASKLDIQVDIEDKKGSFEDYIEINANAFQDNIGFGSYNLIEVIVKNLKDYYVSTELRLSRSKETEVFGDDKQILLLKPGEEKKINWIVRVSDELEGGYMYTFPFVISSIRNLSVNVNFDAREDGKKFSLERIQSIIGDNGEEEKVYTGDVELDCKSDKSRIYEYETTVISCDVKNVGNVYLEELNVCLEDDCKKLSLGITQEGSLSFDFKPKEIGSQEISVKANNKDVSKSAFVDIIVYDQPVIEFGDVVYPSEVEYNDIYEISFLLNKKSRFAPSNVSIRIEPVGKEWEINQLNEDRNFILKMYGSELKAGGNNFRILVEYKDENGKSYETSKEFTVNLVNVNILQRITIFFKSIGKGIMGVFK